MTPSLAAPITFHYRFDFGDGVSKEFEIHLDADSLELIDRPADPPPDWARLDNHRCANCPLVGQVEYCPVAVNLAQVVESFKDSISYEVAVVTVTTPMRTYQKATSLQRGISSIIGIYNVTSNCPHLDRLRPMARFHLPFASVEETAYRATSMYLLAQYFAARRGDTPDWDLDNLRRIYEALVPVEVGLSRRLRFASRNDANVNAVIVLSVFGQELRLLLEDRLRSVEHWFAHAFKNDE
jgi:hypothetical protein